MASGTSLIWMFGIEPLWRQGRQYGSRAGCVITVTSTDVRTSATGHERDVTLLGMSVRALMGIRVRSRPIGIMSEGMAMRLQPWRCRRGRGSPDCGAVALTERNMQTAADVGPAS